MSPQRGIHSKVSMTVVTVAFLVVVSVVAFLIGSTSVSFQDFWALITGAPLDESARSILINFRLPRVAAAVLAGAALAMAGAIIQGVLNNPLASDNIIGINAGAGLAVLLASSLFAGMGFLLPVAAFVGALVAAAIVFAISLGAGTSRLTVVLAGIAISSIFGAGMNLILIINPDAYIGASSFLVGSLEGITAGQLIWPAIYIILGLIVGVVFAGKLNIISLGETTAHSLGMNVGRWRMGLLALAALLAGAAVSFVGLLGFVGLIVPHIVRFFVGHDNRIVLPLSTLFGAAFVVLCDLIGRVAFAPYELPVGILMAFLGGPFFIYLIIKNRKFGNG